MLVGDFWSGVSKADITISVTPEDIPLPDVEVNIELTNLKPARVIPIIKVRKIANTSCLKTNRIHGNQNIKIKKPDDDWYKDGVVAIELPDKVWAVSRRRIFRPNKVTQGNLIIGTCDVKDKVDCKGIYNFKLVKAKAKANSLLLSNVQVGVRLIWEKGIK